MVVHAGLLAGLLHWPQVPSPLLPLAQRSPLLERRSLFFLH
jgi:hypothetical protein